MKTLKKSKLSLALSVALLGASASTVVQASSITEALTSGKASVDMNLRYEGVDLEAGDLDASALTLRTRFSYTTGTVDGFSAKIEMEDNRIVLGQGDYTVGPTGYNLGEHAVIADPEHTELDQGYIQYKSGAVTAKFGRQIIALDGQRHIGHVGWRNDRQTYDALSVNYAADNLSFTYAYSDQRNRIFAEAADVDSKDHIFNLAYTTPYGKLVGYSYLLEVDNATDNGLDTYGVSFNGSTKAGDTKVIYGAEFAVQSNETGGMEYDTNYINLVAGAVFSGVTAKLGYEVLGSDDGMKSFAAPLSTLFKFNGWADAYLGGIASGNLGVGLVDTSVTLTGKVFGGSLMAVYHDFSADEASATVDDLGSEINLRYSKKFGKNYSAAVQYAGFSGGDTVQDIDKVWVWFNAKF